MSEQIGFYMAKFVLHSDWEPRGDQPKAITSILRNYKKGKKRQTLLGVTGSGKTFVMAHIIQNLGLPALVMSPNKTLAAQLYSEFKNFFPENAVEYFVSYYDFYQPEAYIPQRDIYIEKDASVNEQIDRLRMSATSSLMSRKDVIIVASVSCVYSLGDPSDYKTMVLGLRKGEPYRREEILRSLVDMQYVRNDFSLSRGNFRARGDVVEVWPGYQEFSLRLEFFGDTLERMGWTDPISGETIQLIDFIVLYAAKHYVMQKEKVDRALSSIREELRLRLEFLKGQGKLLESARLESRTLYDLEILQEVGYCSGIENYARHFSDRRAGERPCCLLDYFPRPFLTIVDESHIAVPQLRGMYGGDRARKETLIEYGFRLPSAMDNRPNTLEEWEKITDKVLFVSATPGDYEIEVCGEFVEQIIRPTGLLDPEIEVCPAKDQVSHLLGLIQEKARQKERVLVTTLTKRLAEDLTEFYQSKGIEVAYLHDEIDTFERVEILQDLRRGKYEAIVGINLLREGLDLPEVSLVAILDADRQGFLRSETSLIQTIGRAARNVNAKVLLYADHVTKAMEKAIEETRRRRKIQMAYNRKHGITPRSVQKEILKSIEQIREADEKVQNLVKEDAAEHRTKEKIAILEKEMMESAAALDFERSAELRDYIFKLQGKTPRSQMTKKKKRSF